MPQEDENTLNQDEQNEDLEQLQEETNEVNEEKDEVKEQEDPNFQDDDTKTNEEAETKEPNKFSEKEKNAFFARIRREQEQKEKTQAHKIEDPYFKGVITATGGINTFTGKPIKDDEDLKEFELMAKLSSQGKDPVGDYLEALKEERRQANLERQKQLEQEQKQNEELEAFVGKYGIDTLKDLSQNDDFCKFADKFNKTATISNIYEMYQEVNTRAETKAKNLELEKEARRKANSGSKGTTDKVITTPNLLAMTREEFEEYKRKRGYN